MPGGGLATKVWLQDRVWARNAEGVIKGVGTNLVLRKSGRDSWASKAPRPQRARLFWRLRCFLWEVQASRSLAECEESHHLASLQSSAAHLLSNQGDYPGLCTQTHPHT